MYTFLGGGFNFFNFHPENWGRWIQFDEHIFQMVWFNPQLEKQQNEQKRIPPKKEPGSAWTPTFLSFGVCTSEITACSSRWDPTSLAASTPNFSCCTNGKRSGGLVVQSSSTGETSGQKLPSTVSAAVKGASYIKAEMLRGSAREDLAALWSKTWKIEDLFDLWSTDHARAQTHHPRFKVGCQAL